MKFSCEKNTLLKEMLIAQEIISSKNALSILSNVYLEANDNKLKVKATDLKVSFETEIPVDVQIPGKTTVFCDKLLSILRSLPDSEILFELSEEGIFFIKPRFNKIDFQLRTMSPDKYPEIQIVANENFFSLPQSDFIDMISKTIFAVSTDETRYFMTGPYFEISDGKLVMVATDGRRLSLIRKKVDGVFDGLKGVIIPTKILNIVRKLSSGEGDLSIAVTDKSIFVKLGAANFSSSLIEGQFPNYQRVIPESNRYKIVVEKELLEEAIKRVAVLAEQKSRKILLFLQNNSLIVSSEESEVGQAKEEIECDYSGPETVIAVNYIYFLEPLREMNTEALSIEFTEETKALTIKPVPEKDYLHIVMPMQVS